MGNFDFKKYLVENKLTSNSRMLNEDNLEVKNIAKQIYSFLVKNGVTTKLIASIPSAGSQGKQIGDKLTGGSNEGLVWYWDDPKTKQTVIEIHLAGGEKGVLEVEKKILSSFPNLEQYNRETPSGPGVFRVVFRVKEKTTAKGGLVGNTNEDVKLASLDENGTYTQKEILRGSMQGFKAPKPEELEVNMMVAPNMAYLDNQELLNQQMGRITAINGDKVTYKKGDGKLYTTEVADLIIVGG